MNTPIEGEPVLAKIEHQNDLGKTEWYEVVLYVDNLGWKSYDGSKTFEDGEVVTKWEYCENLL